MTPQSSLGVRVARLGMALAVLVLAVLQIALTWEFWGSFGDQHNGQRIVFQGIGASLSIIEALALVIAGDLATRGKRTKALLAIAVFFPTFMVNLGSDVSALALYSARDTELRGLAVAAYEGNEETIQEADARISTLEAELNAQGLNRPSAALIAERDGLADRIQRRENTGQRVPERSRRELARLESAVITATELEDRRAARTAAREANAAIGNRPHESHPQFEAIAGLLRAVGFQAEPEQVRLWIAFGIGLTVKLWLAFGLFLASDRTVREAEAMAEKRADEGPDVQDMPSPAAEPSCSSDGRAKQREPMPRSAFELLNELEAGRA